MSNKVRSARGEVVDFDLLAIKQQLAAQPTPISVSERRRFIDERDGLKPRAATPVPNALAMSARAAEASAKSKK